jgi:hypothetical protein
MSHKSRGVQEEELAFLRGDYLKNETVQDSRFHVEPEINTSNSEGIYICVYTSIYMDRCMYLNICVYVDACRTGDEYI